MKDASLAAVARLHAEIDLRGGEIARLHAGRLQCRRGCSSCCIDGVTVFAVEAELIRRRHGDLLRDAAPHAPGACAFLDADGGCRIYEDRPYVCRTQGLPLRWIEVGDDGSANELRDICPLNEAGGPPLERLESRACWTLGETEGHLAELQRVWGGGAMTRVALRELFRRGAQGDR